MVNIIVVAFIFLAVVPTATFLTHAIPSLRKIFLGMMVYFTSLDMIIHVYSIPEWRGTTWGYGISMVDVCALILLFSMGMDRKAKLRFFPPGAWLYVLYFVLTALSGFNAIFKFQWSFEIVKMIWMYVAFIAMYNYLNNSNDLWTIIYVICATVMILFIYGLYQKYFTSIYQIKSTMPHQNSLAMYLEICGCVLLGVLLNEKINFMEILVISFSFMVSSLLLIFTMSRGGLLCFGFGVVVLMGASLILNGITARQVVLFVLSLVCGAIFLSILIPRIIHRFENAPENSAMGRKYIAIAAIRVANDFTFGGGANNFCIYSSNSYDYARELRAMDNRKLPEDGSHLGPVVETIYLLVAAECGWGTFALLICWLFFYLILAIILSFKFRHKPYFGVILGCGCGLLCNYMQSCLEWCLKQYGNFYQLMLIFGIIAYFWTRRAEILETLKKEK